MPGGLDDGEVLLDDRQRVGMTRVEDRVLDLRQLVKVVLSLHNLRLHRLYAAPLLKLAPKTTTAVTLN